MQQLIQEEIHKLSALLLQIQNDAHLLRVTEAITEVCLRALKAGKKILFAGNGGSASDSQHLAAELVGRLRYHRPGLPGLALTTDTSALTAISNDYGYEYVFSRQIESLGQKGDVFIGISTSGKSPNILTALKAARELGLSTIGFAGAQSPLMVELCDHVLNVPANETSHIQECHIMLGHIICGLIEDALFKEQYHPLRKQVTEVA